MGRGAPSLKSAVMDLQTFQPLFDWLASHPGWAGFFVFLIALTESLVVVGLIVPGTVLMFGVGTLLGAGVLGLWETLTWAFLGAVCGDGVSFWLGRHYHDRIHGWWPFRNHPEMLAKGRAFFQRHGGKSVLFGRFVGPVRPVIPAVAGMMQMPVSHFLLVNVLSALLWAPAYLLPGMAFGASMELASEVAGRLAVLVLVLAVLVVLAIGLVRYLARRLAPWAAQLADRLLVWGWGHPHLGRLTAWLVDPAQPEAKGLALWAGLLLAVAVVLLVSLFLRGDQPLALDVSVYHFLHDLHTPWANHWLSALVLWADPLPVLGLAAGAVMLLLVQGRRMAALHVLISIVFAVLVIALLGDLRPARPPLMHSAELASGFPAWHTLGPLVLLGFLAILTSHSLPPAWRWLPYSVVAALVTAFSLANLYLGINWLSDVVVALVLGMAWVAVLGLAYRRRRHERIRARPLVLTGLLLYTGLGWAHLAEQPRLLAQMTREVSPVLWTAADWREGLWRDLEPYRWDLKGARKQPLNLQWQGELEHIRASLTEQGWQDPPELNWANALRWFSARPRLAQLPLLPNVHQGRHEALRLVKPEGENRQWLLRLWPTAVRVDGRPLWQGYVVEQGLERQFEYFWLPRLSDDFQTSLTMMTADLGAWQYQWVWRNDVVGNAVRWQGEVLLVGRVRE